MVESRSTLLSRPPDIIYVILENSDFFVPVLFLAFAEVGKVRFLIGSLFRLMGFESALLSPSTDRNWPSGLDPVQRVKGDFA
jgi:hypothetical protein